jgi:hypothetical protein
MLCFPVLLNIGWLLAPPPELAGEQGRFVHAYHSGLVVVASSEFAGAGG